MDRIITDQIQTVDILISVKLYDWADNLLSISTARWNPRYDFNLYLDETF